MNKGEMLVDKLGEKILIEKRIIEEMSSFFKHLRNSRTPQERVMISSQLRSLTRSLNKAETEATGYLEKISLTKPLQEKPKEEYESSPERERNKSPFRTQEEFPVQSSISTSEQSQKQPISANSLIQNIPKMRAKVIQGPIAMREKEIIEEREKEGKDGLTPTERLSIKRMLKKDKKEVKVKDKKPSSYAKISSRFFYPLSMSFLKKGMFEKLKRDLVRGSVEFIPATYLSIIFFSTILSFVIAIFIVIFFSFLSLTFAPPFITLAEGILERFLKLIWLVFLLPVAIFAFGYFYPSLERKTLEKKIDQELPFAAIHMSAVSSSMIEPSKMFSIIISTGEYPHLKREFIKLQNEINIYGYDLVTALKNRSFNSPSKKLAELFNGLATTITSGGNLPIFFEKRAQTLLFEYRLEVEKQGKSAETFMDIYISVVIAAPMVLMLLLMMMRISGLGIALSPAMITLTVISAVSVINMIFLSFLHLKEQRGK
ncbi:MAG: type II secretion system F family protein [Nanoarchaeota archaeon]|nr:type II secretion system F family protein [Nanoarchaeota archaeon]